VTGTRRIVYWALSTLTAVVLLFGYHTSTSGPSATSAETVIVGGPAASGSGSTGAGTSGGPSSKAGTSGRGGSADARTSTVTGAVANTEWGPVQVQLTMSGGSITKVSVLQYPNGNSRDAEINGYALPILIRETVDAQSAHIDMVSGATITSGGYVQSLQSALDQAGL
jgi:uncharacterized protein with FMN-binding domain